MKYLCFYELQRQQSDLMLRNFLFKPFFSYNTFIENGCWFLPIKYEAVFLYSFIEIANHFSCIDFVGVPTMLFNISPMEH
ncbi:Hypothetical predicted protein [Octopus vulgaris]|uniref:Uncharacterized protein n=1 Tax=Octopus vulgaris TaxID=6645 RepID=A0AA36EZ47_OCTVU|nr:Hypothetical predicted protein [Octopus vulgaris]